MYEFKERLRIMQLINSLEESLPLLKDFNDSQVHVIEDLLVKYYSTYTNMTSYERHTES